MTDVVSKETRSRMMSGIKGKDTGIEMTVRRGLHAAGFRYRLHGKDLPGRPDIVLPRHRAVIQVNGCFWHGHDCPLFKMPASNRQRWIEKIEGNRERDRKNREMLIDAGWRVLDVWECALRGAWRQDEAAVLGRVRRWVASGKDSSEILGEPVSSPTEA